MKGSSNPPGNQRLGLALFGIYLVLYAAFIGLCAFAPSLMEWRPLGRLNLAIVYGFGLILAAFVLSMIYGVLCRADQEEGSQQ